jgi:hypothetical protein
MSGNPYIAAVVLPCMKYCHNDPWLAGILYSHPHLISCQEYPRTREIFPQPIEEQSPRTLDTLG